VLAFADSFVRIAPGMFPSRTAWLHFALALPATLMHAAILVAAPAIAVAATLHLALAAVTRVVPRFGAFSLAFPFVFAAALCVTVMMLPQLIPLGSRPWLVVPWELAR
jgi:flagellar biosynthesis protein FliR